MKKTLILASVASMISQFNLENINILQEIGYEVHVACNFIEGSTCDQNSIEKLKKYLIEKQVTFYQIDFVRSVNHIISNYKAYKQVKELLDKNNYQFIHCHSPIGGVIGRIAGHQKRIKVIYTAHGFHFYKGAPLKNWLVYYSVEWWLSHYTDTIITVNTEDYKRALTEFKSKRVEYISGVGVDIKKFQQWELKSYLNYKEYYEEKRKRRGEFCKINKIPEDALILLSVGEININKNHRIIIEALRQIKIQYPKSNIHYCIAGKGNLSNDLEKLAEEYGLQEYTHFLGYREDVSVLYGIADIFAFPSKREGLGIAAIEAMASGLPLLTSNVHGINDYSVDGVTGYKCNPHDAAGFAKAILRLNRSRKKMFEIGLYNQQISKKFSVEIVKERMLIIYRNSDDNK